MIHSGNSAEAVEFPQSETERATKKSADIPESGEGKGILALAHAARLFVLKIAERVLLLSRTRELHLEKQLLQANNQLRTFAESTEAAALYLAGS
jgi:hypothetical protein